MTIRLRAHHLLCLLTYVGKGYSSAFTANYDGIVERLSQGEDILVVEGPDDICAPLLGEDDPHCLRASVMDRDERAAEDVAALLSRPILGERLGLDPAVLGAMRRAFQSGKTRQACSNCEWSGLCSSIADVGFVGVRLKLPLMREA